MKMRTVDYEQDSLKWKWNRSGAMEHTLECLGNFNKLHLKHGSYSRGKELQRKKVREALKSKRARSDEKAKLFNQNDRNYVITCINTPLYTSRR